MELVKSSITIYDYNDAISLFSYIDTNHSRTQIYNPDTNGFIPDWNKDNLELSVSLYNTGESIEQILSPNVLDIKWYLDDKNNLIQNDNNFKIHGEKKEKLTVSNNILEDKGEVIFICSILYYDSKNQIELEEECVIKFSKIINGSGLTYAVMKTPNGNIFKDREIKTLTAKCSLYKNDILIEDNLKYKWFYDNNKIQTRLTKEEWIEIDESTHSGITGFNTDTLLLSCDSIYGYQKFKCEITDETDGKKYSDFAIFIKNEEFIYVVVTSSAGTVFKNDLGNTTLTARLFKKGQELDINGKDYIYMWEKYDVDEIKDENFHKSGKSIRVDTEDVDSNNNFVVRVFSK